MNFAKTLRAVPKRPVRREKTFTGCWTCRSRKVKCDEGIPGCSTCIKRGIKCSGYEPIYIWVTGYSDYPPGRRRVLRSDLTWHGHKIHQGPEVDELIARCDFDNHNEPEELERAAGPFKVFWAPTGNPQSLFDIPNASRKDTKLFRELYHHYFTVTAQNMMPFKDTRNPWRSVYPCLARRNAFKGQQALYYAMFAQAAGNLAQLGSRRDEMSRLATKYYAISLQSLWASLGDMDFCSVLASSATLMMAEVYTGISNSWRTHLNGAWSLLMSRKNEKLWEGSEEAWVIAQSLCLVKIRADTMQQPNLRSTDDEEMVRSLISSIAYRDDFGFTAGAGRYLMKCIHEITYLESRLRLHQNFDIKVYQNTIDELCQRIESCQLEAPAANELSNLHHHIFKAGVLIHFHKRILEFNPSRLVPLLDVLFDAIEQYRMREGGHVTLWPVFIGAVEAVQDRHKDRVRAWLDEADSMGAANRKEIRVVIEAVWRERSRLRDLSGGTIEEEEINVDWRDMIKDMGIELLLI